MLYLLTESFKLHKKNKQIENRYEKVLEDVNELKFRNQISSQTQSSNWIFLFQNCQCFHSCNFYPAFGKLRSFCNKINIFSSASRSGLSQQYHKEYANKIISFTSNQIYQSSNFI